MYNRDGELSCNGYVKGSFSIKCLSIGNAPQYVHLLEHPSTKTNKVIICSHSNIGQMQCQKEGMEDENHLMQVKPTCDLSSNPYHLLSFLVEIMSMKEKGFQISNGKEIIDNQSREIQHEGFLQATHTCIYEILDKILLVLVVFFIYQLTD